MTSTRWLCVPTAMSIALGLFAAALAGEPEDSRMQRQAVQKAYKDGNFNDAYQGLRRLALDPNDDPRQVGADLDLATQCLVRLNRVDEIDAFREAVIEVHGNNWRLLWAAAQNYMHMPHQGFIVAGRFERGNKRGGGRMVNATKRDRVRALQLMVQALPKAREDDNHGEVSRFLLDLAGILLNNRGYGEAWRLQYLADLDELPDYDEGWHSYRKPGGAPVDADGNPVFHHVPESFETAETDGQRWRWCLQQAMEFDPRRASEVRTQLADFLWNQFGVQTMARYGWRFGRVETDDTKDDTSGTYALHSLAEKETIARLATGVKRFELPDEFNFVKIYHQIADEPRRRDSYGQRALVQLAQIFENRRQYPRVAGYWQRLIAEYPTADPRARRNWQDRLDQIVGNWGRFEPVMTQPAGRGATVEYRFRNGRQVELTAHEINVPKLLDDVKAYLKSHPTQLDRQKLDVSTIGYRLVERNQKEYLGRRVAQWRMDLDPRDGHFDKRVTVTTPLQKAGAYLLTAKMNDGNTSHIVLWLADTAIAKKPLDGKTFYYVADAATGKPIPKVNVEFFGWRQERRDGRRLDVLVKRFAEHTDADGQGDRRPRPAAPGLQLAHHRHHARRPAGLPGLHGRVVRRLLRLRVQRDQGLHDHRPARLSLRADGPLQVLGAARQVRQAGCFRVCRSPVHG